MTNCVAFNNLLPHDLSDEMAFHLTNSLSAFACYVDIHYHAQIMPYTKAHNVYIETYDDRRSNDEDDFDDAIPF